MDSLQYEGLFYLSSGLGIFVSMTLGLRLLSQAGNSKNREQDDAWHAREALEIIERIEECTNVVTLRFKRANGKPMPTFKAGQFLSVQIGADEKLTRSYSISSSTANLQNIQISVKLLSGGKGSSWVHQLKVGDKILAYPPSGHFSDSAIEDQPRVYIGGGIGITPLISMIQSNLDSGRQVPMTLFYGMRTRQDLAFHSLLQSFAHRHSQFKYYPFLSHEDGDWAYEKGFLTIEEVRKKSAISDHAHYFLCGPSVMTEPLMDQLSLAGVSDDRIHNEKFASAEALDRTKIQSRTARVTFQGTTYEYSGQQTLLEFFEEKGVQIPYACRTGVCGSCKCLAEGKTEALTDAGLTRKEKASGYILTCVSFPSDKEVHLKR